MADEQLDDRLEPAVPVDEPVDESVPGERWQLRLPDALCIGGIALTIIRGWVSLLFVAKLIGTHPVWLELIRGSSSSMITAGAFARDGRASLVLALIAGTIGLGFLDVFYWWAGRRYGNRILAFYTRHNPRYRRWIARSERFLARWGGVALVVQYFQPIPSVLIFIGTGAAGLPLWQWFVFNTIGCLLWVGLMVGLGYAIGHPAVSVAKTISHDALLATVALVVVVMIVAIVQSTREYRRQSD